MSDRWTLTEEDAAKIRQINERSNELGIANSAALPLYDPDATCPKCGADAARVMTEHHFNSPDLYYDGGYSAPRKPCSFKFLADHLCRTCGRCSYSWQERSVDNALAERSSRTA